MNTPQDPQLPEVEPRDASQAPQPPEAKVHFGPELTDFLVASETSYRDMGDTDKADEIRQAREQLGDPNAHSAAIAEVYLFAEGWKDEMQVQSLHRDVEEPLTPAEEQAAENYYGARAIFIRNCETVFPVIAEIPHENVGPELQEMESLLSTSCPALPELASRLGELKLADRTAEFDKLLESDPMLAIDIIDQMSSAASQSIDEALRAESKEGLSVEFQAQLNVCILQMYRLELLRDSLEKEMRRAQTKDSFQTTSERPAPAQESPEASEQNPEELWQKYFAEKMGSMDEWLQNNLPDFPHDIFGEKLDPDYRKWRAVNNIRADIAPRMMKEPDQAAALAQYKAEFLGRLSTEVFNGQS